MHGDKQGTDGLVEEKIKQVIEEAGIPSPDDVFIDSKIHHFSTNGFRGDRAGYYQFWDHGTYVAGYFGDFRSCVKGTFCSKEGGLTEEDKRRLERAREKAEQEREELARRAAKEAQGLLNKAGPPDPAHPYLVKKGIKPAGPIKQLNDTLLIPVTDVKGDLRGVQKIFPDGSKEFLSGMRTGGSFFCIGHGEPYYVCEGYATGASVYEAIEGQGTVIVALYADNLKPVALAIHKKYPQAEIVICADNDQFTVGNPGVTKASEAAKAVGAKLAVPEFKDTTSKPTDFNDLHLFETIQAVKECLAKARHPELSETDIEEELDRLAGLSPVAYDLTREKAAKRLGIRVTTLDKEVESRRKAHQEAGGLVIEALDPWPEAVSGIDLLNEVKNIFQRYVVLSEEQAVACTLWTVLTYCYDSFLYLPLLAITSPQKRCGKTTLLEVLAGLTKGALPASNITSAALFRVVETWKPCLLIDEADTFLSGNEELRGILNSGHKKKFGFVVRINGDSLEPERFSTWCPKAVALIGKMPDTLCDRSVEIRLERKLPGETVERLPLDFIDQMKPIRQKICRWTNDNTENLKAVNPQVPNLGNDRAVDNWLPLLTIAELAGGEWPEVARNAMLAIETKKEETNLRVELLADIRDVLDGKDRIASKDLVNALVELEDKPWAEFNHGKPITPNTLAKLLKAFGIRPKTIRLEGKTAKGYEANQFAVTFQRYLSTDTPLNQNVTTEQANNFNNLDQNQNVTQTANVTFLNEAKYAKSLKCYGVTFSNQGAGEKGNATEETSGDQPLFEFEL